MTRRAGARGFRRLAAAAVLVALVLPVAASPVAAATPDLTLVTDTTYDVRPDEGRVAVTSRVTATNRLRDTVARRFFFRTAFLAVLPGASNFEIRGGRGTPEVSVRQRAADHTLLRIDLGANLAARRSTNLTLTFDLRDPGGAPDRAVRISPSLVTFDAWAFATPDTPGSSVTITLPEGYSVGLGRGPLDGPTMADGRQTFTTGRLSEPLEFVADVTADRPAEHLETSRLVPLEAGEAEILLRPWPDDPAWRDRVGDLVARALPALEREIGLPWPVEAPLAVEESLLPGGHALAGVFDPAEPRLEIAYSASDGAIVQQLAHGWFNGRLVADRWIAEAFAAYYAERAAATLGIEPASPELTEELAAAAIPLNAWTGTEPAEGDADAYGRAAALALAREVGERAGSEGLADVWALAAAGTGAYQPTADAREPLPGVLDWRSLLDLLEDRTGRSIDDLWQRWVGRPDDLEALSVRAEARRHLAATLERAGDWSLPRSIREALRAWQFEAATEQLASADRVIAARDELAGAAEAEGLALPDRLRTFFEGGAALEVAEAEAAAELAVVAAIREARASRPAADSPATGLMVAAGLVGTDPEARIAEASTALAAGDVDGAFDAAAAAEDLWSDATRVGRGRIVSLGLLALSILLLLGIIRQRRQRRVPDAA